jgi:hypothetical protein
MLFWSLLEWILKIKFWEFLKISSMCLLLSITWNQNRNVDSQVLPNLLNWNLHFNMILLVNIQTKRTILLSCRWIKLHLSRTELNTHKRLAEQSVCVMQIYGHTCRYLDMYEQRLCKSDECVQVLLSKWTLELHQ